MEPWNSHLDCLNPAVHHRVSSTHLLPPTKSGLELGSWTCRAGKILPMGSLSPVDITPHSASCWAGGPVSIRPLSTCAGGAEATLQRLASSTSLLLLACSLWYQCPAPLEHGHCSPVEEGFAQGKWGSAGRQAGVVRLDRNPEAVGRLYLQTLGCRVHLHYIVQSSQQP